MSESVVQGRIVVIHEDEKTDDTAQTRGMLRLAGVDSKLAGASRIWMGRFAAPPGMTSAKHHHGEAETAAYVLRGHMHIYYGDDYKERIDAGPGDFIFVPGYLPHYETNPSQTEPCETIFARSPDNIVVNLE